MVRSRFYEYIELVIPGVTGGNTTQQFNFPDLPQIRNTPIYGIVAYNADIIAASPLTFQPVITAAEMKTMFLTLFSTDPETQEQKNGIDRMPLGELNYFLGSTTPHVMYMREFVGQTVTWPKSFINLSAPLNNTTNLVVVFGVYYGYSKKVQQ